MVNKKYSKNFHSEIKSLLCQGMTNPEIAKTLGLSNGQVSSYTQRFLGGNPNYLSRRKKHSHLHEKILKMRLRLTDEEVRNKLGLTKSEMKSCLTCAYKKSELKHLRKDSRRHDSWSVDELIFLLKWSGIISRKEISEHLKRGKGSRVIKEKLQQLGLCSKNVNGLTYSQFVNMFKKSPDYYICTNAGSGGSREAGWKLVPWCHIQEMIKDRYLITSDALSIYIKTMASFQRWIHGENYWKSLCSLPCFKRSEL